MKQFLVPQFIDVEDKILGPITMRQFILMLVSALLLFILYKLLSFFYFIAAGLLDLGMFATLAFAKINGRPIHFFLLNFLQTSRRPNFRVWSKSAFVRDVQDEKSEIKEKTKQKKNKEPISGSRLQDVSLVVNTGGLYEGENEDFTAEERLKEKPIG